MRLAAAGEKNESAEAKALAPEQLIEQIITRPGGFDQMCLLGRPLQPGVAIPLYGEALHRDFYVEHDKLEELMARRAEVIPALARMIDAIDPTRMPVHTASELSAAPFRDPEPVQNSGVSKSEVSGLLLNLVTGLHALELLPNLLALEERLTVALSRADRDPKAPAASVAQDGYPFVLQKKKLSPRELRQLMARVVQRELLSTMLGLVREQRFQPLLDSEFEKTFRADTEAKLHADPDLAKIHSKEDAESAGYEFDPIANLPIFRPGFRPTLPYTSARRKEARRLIGQFLATVPPEKWVLPERQ